MAAFLVERYWPGLTAEAVAAVGSVLAVVGAHRGAVIVETVVSAKDEVCLWFVEAETQDAVEGSFAAAGVPVDRIGPVARHANAAAPAKPHRTQ